MTIPSGDIKHPPEYSDTEDTVEQALALRDAEPRTGQKSETGGRHARPKQPRPAENK
jgi:hypothetical protein